MFLYFVSQNSTLEVINHKFLVAGHTHMECDSDHALIEKEKKKTNLKINHLNDWVQLIRLCKRQKPFTVIQMGLDNFYDFSALAKNNGPFIIKKKQTRKEKNFIGKMLSGFSTEETLLLNCFSKIL